MISIRKKAFWTTHVGKGNENIKNNIFLYGTINVIVEQMLYNFRENLFLCLFLSFLKVVIR